MALPPWAPWLDAPESTTKEPQEPEEPEDKAARCERLLNEAYVAWEEIQWDDGA